MCVRKLLDLSTAHLPQEVGEYLAGFVGVVASALPHGWLMWVPDVLDDLPDDGTVPAEVLVVQRYALRLGCNYVLLRADGPVVDELPLWNW